MEKINCEVCILGGGTAGMAAAYALIQHLKGKPAIVLIDREVELGGTATQAWVETWIEGINPPYLQNIFQRLQKQGKGSGSLEKSWLSDQFNKDGNNNGLIMDGNALSSMYRADMELSGARLFTSFSFQRAVIKGRKIESVIAADKKGNEVCIEARFFIDSSGDGVLCTYEGKEGVDYFVGEDPYDRFQESLMKKSRGSRRFLNEPSLFFKLAENVDDTTTLKVADKTVYSDADIHHATIHPSYINNDGYYSGRWVNPMSGQGIEGIDLIENGYLRTYRDVVEKRQYEYWKYVKLELQRQHALGIPDTGRWGAFAVNKRNFGHTNEHAPMLGIRESYRIHCDQMLCQKDLTEMISSQSLQRNIACGAHVVDLHVYGHIDHREVAHFNETELRPSGIPYDCLIPRRFDNVLVACRAFGASHIALSARRINKDMAQLGWAAGHAIAICLEDHLSNTRSVDAAKLQSKEYTNIVQGVKEIEIRLKDRYKLMTCS